MRVLKQVSYASPSPDDSSSGVNANEPTALSIKSRLTERLESVPDWMYSRPEEFCGRWTLPAFLWTANLLACIFHCVLIVVTILVSTNGGKGLDTPTISIYRTELVWNASVVNSSLPARGGLTPTLVPGFKLSISIVSIVFFALSASAHGLICLLNASQAFAVNDYKSRRVTRFTGWYFVWIHGCRQPLRWLEYSISAAVMAVVLFAASGIVVEYTLALGVMAINITMAFGFIAEELCRPLYDTTSGKPTVWIKSRERPDTLFFEWIPCLAPLERLFPNLLGWVPYSSVWAIFFHSFLSNAANSTTGQSAPTFVYVILISQAVLFSCFGFVSIVNLSFHNGPSFFANCELTYILLSFLAKGLLGGILITSVLIFDTFEEAAAS